MPIIEKLLSILKYIGCIYNTTNIYLIFSLICRTAERNQFKKLCMGSLQGMRVCFLTSTRLKLNNLKTMLEILWSTYEHWYFGSIKKYSYTPKCQKKKCVKKLNLVINWHEIVEILNLTPYKTVVDYGVFEDAIKNAKDNEVLSQNMTLTIARWIHNELVFMSSFWS